MLEFVYLELFERSRRGVLSDAEVQAVEDALLANPRTGVVMAGTGGVRKVRAAQDGRGKSGSTRVVYLHVPEQATVCFILAFPKNVQGNLTDEQKRAVRLLAAQVKQDPWPRRLPAYHRQANGQEQTMANNNNDDAFTVTNENFGDLLIQGMREAVAVRRGTAQPARRVQRPVTAREAIVQPPRQYQGPETQRIREGLGLSQAVFARVLNASAETVKAWEQGKRQPDGMALTLLEIAETHPQALMSRVRLREGVEPRGGSATGR